MCQMFIHMSLESRVAQIFINSQNRKEGNLPKFIELLTFFIIQNQKQLLSSANLYFDTL